MHTISLSFEWYSWEQFVLVLQKSFYLSNATIDAPILVKKCPKKRIAPNTPHIELLVKKGFWRDSQNTAILYYCNNNARVGHQLQTSNSLSSATRTNIWYKVGPLCKVCINSQQFLLQSFERNLEKGDSFNVNSMPKAWRVVRNPKQTRPV